MCKCAVCVLGVVVALVDCYSPAAACCGCCVNQCDNAFLKFRYLIGGAKLLFSLSAGFQQPPKGCDIVWCQIEKTKWW